MPPSTAPPLLGTCRALPAAEMAESGARLGRWSWGVPGHVWKCCVMADSATAAAVGFLSSLQARARLHRARQNGFKLCGVGALKLQVLPGLRLSAHHA